MVLEVGDSGLEVGGVRMGRGAENMVVVRVACAALDRARGIGGGMMGGGCGCGCGM